MNNSCCCTAKNENEAIAAAVNAKNRNDNMNKPNSMPRDEEDCCSAKESYIFGNNNADNTNGNHANNANFCAIAKEFATCIVVELTAETNLEKAMYTTGV